MLIIDSAIRAQQNEVKEALETYIYLFTESSK